MKINKYGLIKLFAEETGCSLVDAKYITDSLTKIIFDQLLLDNKINFGEMGYFSILHRKQKKGTNPKTKQAIIIHPNSIIKFTQYDSNKRLTNKQFCK